MRRARATAGEALRVAGALLVALSLASLPLVFFVSDDKPASLNLPPFEKEVYLSVTAKWAPNDCVDVTVVTNLPKGTRYELIAQRRRKPGTLKPFERVDQILYPEDRARIVATSNQMTVPEIFCGLVHARKHGGKQDTFGLLIAVAIAHRGYILPNVPFERTLEEQALRIGPNGSLLRGPLVRSHEIDGEHRKYAQSKIFILEPLPMLPEDEESEEEEENE